MKVFSEKIIAVFFVLCIAFIPLNFDGKGIQYQITTFIFQDLIQIIQRSFFDNALKNADFSSDTIGLNVFILELFLISNFVVFGFQIFKIKTQKLIPFSRIAVVYYLAFVLLKYGFDKIFKAQFYLPEPNILHTQFGDLSRDILYWSTIGTSRFYSISLGIIEVFTAVLLLINRTRVLGLLLAIGVFVNVILVNFGFDISVKTFSILLFMATVYAVFPFLKAIFNFLILKKLSTIFESKVKILKNQPLQNGIKTFAIGMMLVLILYPYIVSKKFNDDNFPRLFLHGVYQVTATNQKSTDFKINRFFIHRKNYLILEDEKGKRIDYFFEMDSIKKQMKLIDYQYKVQFIKYSYSSKDSVLQLQFPNFELISKAQNWRKLRVLQNDFHFTIDEIK
jgi:hypothetical protein